MTIADMAHVLGARILCHEEKKDTPVYTACCSDLMSDVLAFVNEKTVLVTGLVNAQVIRTAFMLDLRCLVFVRGKTPTEDMVREASEQGLVILSTTATAFEACGLLYGAGMRGAPIHWPDQEAGT